MVSIVVKNVNGVGIGFAVVCEYLNGVQLGCLTCDYSGTINVQGYSGNYVLTATASNYNTTSVNWDGVSNITIVMTAVQPSTTIIAIRIQNVATGTWYNWDYGPRPWTVATSIIAGASVYIVVYATTPVSQNVTINLINADTGATLATKTAYAVPGSGSGQGIYVEWTGTMPQTLTITSTSSP